MPEKILSTEPPDIITDDFEDYIATDELFVDYFNEFLALPSFPEPLRFNTDSGGFEVLTSAKYDIAQQIKTAARNKKISKLTQKEWLAEHARNSLKKKEISEDDEIKTNFVVKCLDKEQGIQWIKQERFPLFLQSELYMEYRLAKLLSQVETSPAGMKLTIDSDFRPWYRSRVVKTPPPPVDETEELIRRMFVTVGDTNKTEIESWATTTKKAEVESVSMTTSRPLSTASSRTGAWSHIHNATRPDNVRGSRMQDIGDDEMSYFDDDTTWSSRPTTRQSPKKVTVIAPTEQHEQFKRSQETAAVPISSNEAACVSKLSTTNVAKIEPIYSDSESDAGMGSVSELSQEESESEITGTTARTARSEHALELKSLEDYASVLVALALKNSVMSLDNNVKNEDLDDFSVFKNLIPEPESWKLGLREAKAPLPVSKLTEQIFAEAILQQEHRILIETGRSSRNSRMRSGTGRYSAGKDLLDLLPGDGRSATNITDTIGFDDISSQYSEISQEDSVFSEQSDDLYSTLDKKDRVYDFVDVKGFLKFLKFISGTIGENLVQFWLDIDKIRFALSNEAKERLLSELRIKYLGVNSCSKITKEILAKWNLDTASKWKVMRLLSTQRQLAEPILLYWGPQFLIRENGKVSDSFSHKSEPLLKKRYTKSIRPISSQSYPTPKTITIRPLRPKSCLPRLKMKSPQPSSATQSLCNSHVMPTYQQLKYHPKYKHQMYHQLKFKDKPLSDNVLKALARNEEAVMQKSQHVKPMSKYLASLLNKGKRAASAGPLTQGNIAIFEQRKKRMSSAVTTTKSLPPYLHPKPKLSISETSTSSISSTGSRYTVRGSDTMESMLQALYHDTKAGWYFTIYCERSSNENWKHGAHFWFDLQKYHSKFYSKVFNEFAVKRSSKVIFARYIVQGSPEHIGVSTKVSNSIHKTIDPPFEELFDAAEEYVLKLLLVPWNEMLQNDQNNYKKVELIEHQRILQVGSKYANVLQAKKEIKKEVVMKETEVEAGEKYEEDLWEKVPEEYRSFTFDELVRNRIEQEHFRKFLEDNYAKTDILCWLDIQAFIRLPHLANEKRDEKAKEIKSKYLHKKYFFGPSSPATKEEQALAVKAAGGWGVTLKERPPNELIIQAQKYVRQRLENRWLPRFLATTAFHLRQRPQSHMAEVAEDVVLQRRKKRGEPWKHLDNRWQSSSDEIREFRKALLNKVTCLQFRRYVSLKGDLLENDVLFWTEVQKYKDFCHIHNEPAAIEVKISAIINCFINSQVPPNVQIDIPQETAEKILEKRKELGPYVFREAQLMVFRVLFAYWNDFCKFRGNISDEKLTTTLQRRAQRRTVQIKKQLNQQHLDELAREEALALEEERSGDTTQDMISQRDSEDVAESVISAPGTNKHMVKWSYGKYVEGLDKERMLLMMENEVKGRIPPEPLPERDPYVSSDESENLASDDEVSSASSGSFPGKKKKRKKKKEKIIISRFRKNSKDGDDEKIVEKSNVIPNGKTSKITKPNLRLNNRDDQLKDQREKDDLTEAVVTID